MFGYKVRRKLCLPPNQKQAVVSLSITFEIRLLYVHPSIVKIRSYQLPVRRICSESPLVREGARGMPTGIAGVAGLRLNTRRWFGGHIEKERFETQSAGKSICELIIRDAGSQPSGQMLRRQPTDELEYRLLVSY